MRCAKLRVPLDRSGALPGSVELRVARVRAERPTATAVPDVPLGRAGRRRRRRDDRRAARRPAARCATSPSSASTSAARGAAGCCAAASSSATSACAPPAPARRARSGSARERVVLHDARHRRGHGGDPARGRARTSSRCSGSPTAPSSRSPTRARYPDRVERLILDSVVDPDETDPFGLAGLPGDGADAARAVPGRLPRRHRRPGRRPRRADRPAARRAAARRLVRRARAAPSRQRDARSKIADLLYDADYARPCAPACRWRCARRWTTATPRRCCAWSRSPRRSRRRRGTSRPRATRRCARRRRCHGRAARRSPSASRVAKANALALPPEAFWPFDAEVAYADEIDLCLRWPDPGRPPRAPGRRLSGRADAAAPGRGGPPHAAGGVGAHRHPHPGRAARHRAGRRARDRRGRPERLRPAPAAALRRRRAVRARCPRVPTDVPATACRRVAFGGAGAGAWARAGGSGGR